MLRPDFAQREEAPLRAPRGALRSTAR